MTTPETHAIDSQNSTFYIVDFDRTLANSDKLLEVFIEIAERHGAIPREQIEAADADVKARGDSFDTASFVRDHLIARGEGEQWNEIEKQYIHESRALNMLLPGAAELLEHLRVTNKNYGILTYGNPFWQHLKLTAAGFNHVPRIILGQKEKGVFISHWQQSDGSFKLPSEYGNRKVDRIIMIDDKAVSFDGFPPLPSRGYYVVDLDHALPSQRGNIPDNVEHLTNLTQVIAAFSTI